MEHFGEDNADAWGIASSTSELNQDVPGTLALWLACIWACKAFGLRLARGLRQD